MTAIPKKLCIIAAICSIVINIILIYSFKEDLFRFFTTNRQAVTIAHASSEIDTNYSTYFSYDSIGSIAFVSAVDKAQILPRQLIIKPDIYSIDNKYAALYREGLYRFVQTDLTVQHRIVYNKNLKSLLSAICWIHTHGRTDNKLHNPERTKKSINGKLYLSCSRISDYTSYLLAQHGYKTRIVEGYTLQQPNGHDDSHSMIEIYLPAMQKWVLADMDNNNLFTTKTDTARLLDYAEMHAALFRNDLHFLRLANDTRANDDPAVDAHFYSVIFERYHSANKLENWYKRVCEVMFIDNHFYNKKYNEAIKQKPADEQYMDSVAYMRTYYGRS